ncbi:hypothetical protein J6590_030297 [Homalodisca vitripennis]|nr:hypothetical protein J6590_030297 [Homalodisca vitripennis]
MAVPARPQMDGRYYSHVLHKYSFTQSAHLSAAERAKCTDLPLSHCGLFISLRLLLSFKTSSDDMLQALSSCWTHSFCSLAPRCSA